jgi:hypothetical protein
MTARAVIKRGDPIHCGHRGCDVVVAHQGERYERNGITFRRTPRTPDAAQPYNGKCRLHGGKAAS